MGRATSLRRTNWQTCKFQSTPSVGRATAVEKPIRSITIYFNPRPPWGGRQEPHPLQVLFQYFNPRPPWGGRRADEAIINSHHNFNPRPPWGGRQARRPIYYPSWVFQSTPSVGRATCTVSELLTAPKISIHALRGEGDRYDILARVPRAISIHALRGEGDGHRRRYSAYRGISIHALRGEGDTQATLCLTIAWDFNPRPPWGGRPV